MGRLAQFHEELTRQDVDPGVDPLVGIAQAPHVWGIGRAAPRPVDVAGRMWLDVAMRHVKIAALKDHLSENLRAVEAGAEVVVMDRNRAIARIVPVPLAGRQVRLLPPSRDFAEIRDLLREPAGWAIPSADLLLAERGER
jgi:antitoxin (DNA-binding transcriptional repressor) of toxin-antitoxin stability system